MIYSNRWASWYPKVFSATKINAPQIYFSPNRIFRPTSNCYSRQLQVALKGMSCFFICSNKILRKKNSAVCSVLPCKNHLEIEMKRIENVNDFRKHLRKCNLTFRNRFCSSENVNLNSLDYQSFHYIHSARKK